MDVDLIEEIHAAVREAYFDIHSGEEICTNITKAVCKLVDEHVDEAIVPVVLSEETQQKMVEAVRRGVSTREFARARVTPLVVSVDRFITNWAEADEGGKLDLWRMMANEKNKVGVGLDVYPLRPFTED